MFKLKKIPAVTIILLLLLNFSSCGDDRVAFGPETGAYEIMLYEDAWTVMDSQSIHQMCLVYENRYMLRYGLSVTIDCYSRSDMADFSAPDFDDFIMFYKAFGEVNDIFEGENNTARELADADPKDIKNKSITSGKRQQVGIISSEGFEAVTEFIFLETADYYLAISYSAAQMDFDNAQDIMNDAVRNLKILK
ncbi:MAG: hypothetical protein FWH24_02525 [Oscillospiraceae bacterium]|nr:hypothetical protein [Oscillospiraceae bacterium]